VRRLEESKGAIAFLDENPFAPQFDYVTRLRVIQDYSHSKICVDRKGNIIVILSPRIEEWIEECILRDISTNLRRRLLSRHPWIGTSRFEEYFHSFRLKGLEDIVTCILEDSEDNRIKNLKRILSTEIRKV
jgi:hypothetical protein